MGWKFPEFAPGQNTTVGSYSSTPHSALAEAEKTMPATDKLIRQQTEAVSEASLLVTPAPHPGRICFHSALNASRHAGRRPTFQPLPQIPECKALATNELVYYPAAPVV